MYYLSQGFYKPLFKGYQWSVVHIFFIPMEALKRRQPICRNCDLYVITLKCWKHCFCFLFFSIHLGRITRSFFRGGAHCVDCGCLACQWCGVQWHGVVSAYVVLPSPEYAAVWHSQWYHTRNARFVRREMCEVNLINIQWYH